MARTKEQRNGRLEEAITNLLQSEALLVRNHAAFLVEKAETDRINSERFARIEAILLDHSRILAEHSRILAEHSRTLADVTRIVEAIPDAVRQKFGFRAPEPPPPGE